MPRVTGQFQLCSFNLLPDRGLGPWDHSSALENEPEGLIHEKSRPSIKYNRGMDEAERQEMEQTGPH